MGSWPAIVWYQVPVWRPIVSSPLSSSALNRPGSLTPSPPPRDRSKRPVQHAPVAKAMNYMLARWSGFTAFLEDGRICRSNNAAERCPARSCPWQKSMGIRRFARRAAFMYTLSSRPSSTISTRKPGLLTCSPALPTCHRAGCGNCCHGTGTHPELPLSSLHEPNIPLRCHSHGYPRGCRAAGQAQAYSASQPAHGPASPRIAGHVWLDRQPPLRVPLSGYRMGPSRS